MDDGVVLSQRKSQPENDVTVHHVHQKRCVPGSMFSFWHFAITRGRHAAQPQPVRSEASHDASEQTQWVTRSRAVVTLVCGRRPSVSLHSKLGRQH